MNNPHIHVVIATFHPLIGGAEKQALAQCKSIQKRGFEVTLITFRHDRKWPRQEIIENVPVLRVAGTFLGGREKLPRIMQKLLYMFALAIMGWTLWQQRRHYDVLHVHQFTMLVLPAALACWLANKPMIIVVHSAGMGKRERVKNKLSLISGPLDSTLPWLQVDALPKVGGELANLRRLGKFGMYFTHVLLRRIRAVPVIINSRMKDYLAEYNFTLPNIQLIPNGVDIALFHPDYPVSSNEERARTVICVARLSYEKGIDVLLQAWFLVQQVPDLEAARLIIVGSGPHEIQLKLMAQELGIIDSVEFVGMQSNVTTFLHRSSFAVLPSRWEGMPVALLEAMACGLACVATRVSGSEDVIHHEVNGLLVEPEDYQGMAQALYALLQNPKIAEKYGKAAQETVEKHYSLEQIIDQYIELYQRIADSENQIIEDMTFSDFSDSTL